MTKQASDKRQVCHCGCGKARTANYPFLKGHKPLTEGIHFIREKSGCWRWIRSTNPRGYGLVSGDMAHRRMYKQVVGPIPVGKVIDHKCGNTLCVNPKHLELVSQSENVRRGYRSKKSHKLISPENCRRIAVRLPDELSIKLSRHLKRKGVYLSEVVQTALMQFLQKAR